MPIQKKRIELTYVTIFIGIVSLAVAAFAAGWAAARQFRDPVPFPELSDFTGTYEWQWAGENWYGKIDLSARGIISRAKVGLLTKTYASDGSASFRMGNKVMQLVSGSYSPKGQSRVKIEMLVRKKVTGQHSELQQTVVGTLEARRCLAGQVEYKDPLTGRSHIGDMILVDYCSHLEDDILAWCADSK